MALAAILGICYVLTVVKDMADYLRKPAIDAETQLEMGIKSSEIDQVSPLLAARHIPGRGYYNPQPLLQASSPP